MKIYEKKWLYFNFQDLFSLLGFVKLLFLFYSGDIKRVAEIETRAFKREVFFSEGSFL